MAEYIEREKALKRFEELKNKADSFRDKVYFDGVMAVIEALPAADVAPVVHGMWEWFDEEQGTPIDGWERDWGWRCSTCKDTLNDEYDDPDNPPKHNYCPKCGAKMDG